MIRENNGDVSWTVKQSALRELLTFLGLFAGFEVIALVGWMIGGFNVFRVMTIIFAVLFSVAYIIYKITTGSEIKFSLNQETITQGLPEKDARRIDNMPLFSNVFSMFKQSSSKTSDSQFTVFTLKNIHTITTDRTKFSFRLKSGLSLMQVSTANEPQFDYLYLHFKNYCKNADIHEA